MQQELWKIPADWFVRWFNTPAYHRLYGPRDQAEADAFVDVLADNVFAGLNNGRLLECACGAGRHAIRFAQHGITVHGMDLAENSIARARERAKELGLASPQIQFSTGDMRNPDHVAAHGPYDAITLLFTSFGYFTSDEEHLQTLRNFHDSLAPGGMFVLDFLNVHKVQRELVEHEVLTRSGKTFEVWRRIQAGWIEKAIQYQQGGQTHLHHERVRAFDVDILSQMMDEIGFHLHSVAGDYRLHPWTEDSPRLILICQKQ